jgi:tetratricopeptide (TPR) repeat protein
MNKAYIIICIFTVFSLSACATAPGEKGKETRPEIALSPEEREAGAFEKFNEILVVSRSTKNREAVLPEMVELYTGLIDEYPDVPVAQESYWKLIEIYVKDFSPPDYKKAEALHNRFVRNYPQSGLKGLVEKTLAVSYYRNKEWDRLLKLSAPGFKGFIEKGGPPFPFLIFMYAEANFQLGNYKEAEKGFQIVIEEFPQLNENKRAKARIEYIKKNR